MLQGVKSLRTVPGFFGIVVKFRNLYLCAFASALLLLLLVHLAEQVALFFGVLADFLLSLILES